MTTRRGIVTPEAVRLDFATAGVATRMLARLIDLMVQSALFFVLLFVFGFIVLSTGSLSAGIIVNVIVGFLIVFVYPAVFEAFWGGRTPGKSVMRIRVVTVEGGPISFRHASIRSMLQLVDFLVIPGGAVALLAGLFTVRTQRLGDLVAGTFVVRDRSEGGYNDAVQFAVPYGTDAIVAALDVSSVSSGQHEMMRQFLLRGTQLSVPARNEISERMVAGLQRQLNATTPQGMHPETFLRVILAAYQRLHGDPVAFGAPAGSLPPPPSAVESLLPPPPGVAPPPPPSPWGSIG